MALSPACTRCGSRNMLRIPRKRWVKKLLPWLNVRPYRCRRCARTTYHKFVSARF